MKKQKLKEEVIELTYVINTENLSKQLSTESVYNWLIVKGLDQFNDGKKLGKCMAYFLVEFGILEQKKS
jgi:hypothetical protein